MWWMAFLLDQRMHVLKKTCFPSFPSFDRHPCPLPDPLHKRRTSRFFFQTRQLGLGQGNVDDVEPTISQSPVSSEKLRTLSTSGWKWVLRAWNYFAASIAKCVLRNKSPTDVLFVFLSYRPGPVCMEKGFATLPVNATQAVATLAVRIWFGSHAWVTEGPAGS